MVFSLFFAAAVAARAAGLPAGWSGPHTKHYSNTDCPNVGNYANSSVADCIALCDEHFGCNAFNFESPGCALRMCSLHALDNPTGVSAGVVSYCGTARHTVGPAGNSDLIRGILNVTAPPFSLDNTGKIDVTVKLQAAVTAAHEQFLALYLPQGVYLVSDTITAYDPNPWTTISNNTFPCRFQPNVMIGE